MKTKLFYKKTILPAIFQYLVLGMMILLLSFIFVSHSQAIYTCTYSSSQQCRGFKACFGPGTCTGSAEECSPNPCFNNCADIRGETVENCGPATGQITPTGNVPKCVPRTKENLTDFPYPGIYIRFTQPTSGDVASSTQPFTLRWDYSLAEGLSWLEKIEIRYMDNLTSNWSTPIDFIKGGRYLCTNKAFRYTGSSLSRTACLDDCGGFYYPDNGPSMNFVGGILETFPSSVNPYGSANLPQKSYTIPVNKTMFFKGKYIRFQILAYWRQATNTNIYSVYKDELQDIYFPEQVNYNVDGEHLLRVNNPSLNVGEAVTFNIGRNETISADSPKTKTYTITNQGMVKMIWNAADYQPLSGKEGFSVIPVDPNGTLAQNISATPTLNLTGVPDLSGYENNRIYPIGTINVVADNLLGYSAIGSPKTIPVNILITQTVAAGFKVLLVGENVSIGNRNDGLTIQYDSTIVDNPPPGFAELLAPYWTESNP